MTNEQFADLWNSSESPDDVVLATGKTKRAVCVKASRLRMLGFTLKAMPSHKVRSLEERFWEKVEKTDGAWWTNDRAGVPAPARFD